MEHSSSAPTNAAAYISARRGVVIREINELANRRKEIFEKVAILNKERDEINRREMEYAKELGFLNRITEVCRQEAEVSPDCADANPPETPWGPDGCTAPPPETTTGVDEPQTAPVPKGAPDRRKRVQLCGATVAARRIGEGVSYKQLSSRTGIPLGELHEIVDKDAPTSPFKAQRLAFALSCTVGELMAPPPPAPKAEAEIQTSKYGSISL